MVQLEVATTIAGVEALRDDWEALCDVAANSTPFQRHAWVTAWMRHTGAREPRVLAVRCGSDLVGVLPAFLWGSPPHRTVSLLGAGPSDHLDAPAAPGFERALLDGAFEWLERARSEWDGCAFDEVGERALLQGLRAPPGFRVFGELQSVCPVLGIPEAASRIEHAVPPRQAARLRKARRRARAAASLTLHRADDGANLGVAMDALFELHGRRWTSRRGTGLLRGPGVRALHEDAARAFAARGALRIYALRVSDRVGAVVYGFREGRRLHLYMQGMDPALEHLSPGTLLVGFVLEDALAEGVREVDFLRGDEPYKYQWGAGDERNVRLCVTR